jgi:hypothetical protein
MSDPAVIEANLSRKLQRGRDRSLLRFGLLQQTAVEKAGVRFDHADLVATLVTLVGLEVMLAGGGEELGERAVQV